jgi:hypothetical protein
MMMEDGQRPPMAGQNTAKRFDRPSLNLNLPKIMFLGKNLYRNRHEQSPASPIGWTSLAKVLHSGNGLLLFLVVPLVATLLIPDLVQFPQGTANLDISWKWSLSFAAQHHFQWGNGYIFTYGPLGYLDTLIYYGGYRLWIISAFFVLVCHTLYLQVLVLICMKHEDPRWSLAWVGKILFCLFLVSGSRYAPQMLTFLTAYGLLCLLMVGESSILLAVFVAFLLAVSSLIKETVLFGACALMATHLTACFFLRDRRKIVSGMALIVAFPFLFVLFWLICGQSLSDLPAYFHGTVELAEGYNIMEMDGYSYQVALALLLMALYLFSIARSWQQNRTAIGLLLVSGPVFFLYWKDGFVRHDPVPWGAHELLFFTAVVYIFLIHYLLTRELFPRTQKIFLSGAIICLLYIFVPACILGGTSGMPGSQIYRALGYASLASHEKSQENIGTELRASYNLPATLTSHLAAIPTLIIPWDLVLAPAYHVPLALPPIPQSYSIYTSYLDHMEATWLDKSQPPQILYSYAAIDGRYPLFEGPEFSYHILRQYAVVASTDNYAVMRRKPVPEPPIDWQNSTQRGHFDQGVALPQADSNHYMFLKVQMHRSFLGKIIGLFYKTASPQIIFHLKDGSSPSYRFVHETGEDDLLVSHCVENMEQYVRLNKMDWAPNVRSISFKVDGCCRWQFSEPFQLRFGTSIIRPRSDSGEKK